MSATIHSLPDYRRRSRKRRPVVYFAWLPVRAVLFCDVCGSELPQGERAWQWLQGNAQLHGACSECGPDAALEAV